ncbi:hypothetical protein KIPB_015507, partial [Kipferlia bialata]|eukprot:g15507.t1
MASAFHRLADMGVPITSAAASCCRRLIDQYTLVLSPPKPLFLSLVRHLPLTAPPACAHILSACLVALSHPAA